MKEEFKKQFQDVEGLPDDFSFALKFIKISGASTGKIDQKEIEKALKVKEDIFTKTQPCPYIVDYFGFIPHEKQNETNKELFHVFVLELCTSDLFGYFKDKKDTLKNKDILRIFTESIIGLEFIHE